MFDHKGTRFKRSSAQAQPCSSLFQISTRATLREWKWGTVVREKRHKGLNGVTLTPNFVKPCRLGKTFVWSLGSPQREWIHHPRHPRSQQSKELPALIDFDDELSIPLSQWYNNKKWLTDVRIFFFFGTQKRY